ncbi:hypothetical protein AYL99_05504 [Fonsecaea erecta]|uniref:Uncharacterized protein n=1 Tax=Fonsecaea erecta TaxID=1367422 RepID=A0A178ZLH4_9EURO|nr:hypothetical protein AYL99_05504 [Fonsecaea erecta]OAP60502.1 hypothetical protein AYL99_05504 [Fonsecaea erecta]
MDYTAVCSFFGSSIFHGELWGNFRDAQLQLDLLLLSIGDQQDHAKAEAFLLQAITFLLQGKHADSQAWLDKIGEIPGISPRWFFRKSSYQILNVAMSRSPVVTWPLHRLSSPVFEVWDSASYPASAVKPFMAASKKLRQHALPIDLFEQDLFCFVFGISHLGFRAQECQYWKAGGREACDGLEEMEDFILMLEGEQFSYAVLRKRALELQLYMTESSLQRLLVEANRALPSLNKDVFAHRLNDVWKLCEERGDDLGVAGCAIMTGDNLVSGQHTSPVFLNMQVGDRLDEIHLRTAEAGYLTPLLDIHSAPVNDHGCAPQGTFEEMMAENVPQHSSLTGTDPAKIAEIERIQAAWKIYDKADYIYQQKANLRGLGAVKLRRACLLSMMLSSAGVMWADHRHFSQLKSRIEKLLIDAGEVFSACGDTIHEKLAKVHLFITEQLSTGSAEKARETGATAEGDRATMLQWYFVCFTQRLGDYYRYFCSSQYGIHCHEIARLLCLRSPTLRFVWFQSVDAITEFSMAFGFSQVAKASIASMLDGLPPLLERLEAAERINADDVEVALCCKNLRWYIVQRLMRRVLSAYTLVGDFTEEGENVLNRLSGQLNDSPEQDFETVDLDTKDLISIYRERRRCSRLLEDGHQSSFNEVAQQMVNIYTQRPSFDVLEQCCSFMIEISDNSIPMRQFTERFVQLDLQQLSYFHDKQTFCKLNGASDEQMEAGNYVMEIFLLERAMGICVSMKRWKNASQIMAGLLKKLPEYATSVYCPTSSMPWQRRLWAGLIAEHEGRYHDALRLFFQSWYFATIGSTQDMDIEQKRFQMSFSDFARIYTCIARLCIYIRTQRFSLPALESALDRDPNDSYLLLSATSKKHIPPERADETAIEWLELGRARNTMTLLNLWKSDQPDSDLSQWLELSRKMTLWTELQSCGTMRTQAEEEEFLQLDREADQIQNFLIDNLGVVRNEMGEASHRHKFATLCSSLPNARKREARRCFRSIAGWSETPAGPCSKRRVTLPHHVAATLLSQPSPPPLRSGNPPKQRASYKVWHGGAGCLQVLRKQR